MGKKECQGEISISCHDAFWVNVPNEMFFLALLKQLNKYVCVSYKQGFISLLGVFMSESRTLSLKYY